jgi:hypothetical protein
MLWCSDISIASYRHAHTLLSIYCGHKLHRSTFQRSQKDGLQNEKKKLPLFPIADAVYMYIMSESGVLPVIVMSLSVCVALK